MTRPLNRPTGLRLGLARTVVALCAVLLLSACDFSVYKLPLPGGADLGDDPYAVTVQFNDVLVLPEHVYGSGNFRDDFNNTAVGSGPYRLLRIQPGKEVVVQRRDDYWARKPWIETVVMQVILNNATAWNAAKVGEIDETMIQSDTWLRERDDPELDQRIRRDDHGRHHVQVAPSGAAQSGNALSAQADLRARLRPGGNLDLLAALDGGNGQRRAEGSLRERQRQLVVELGAVADELRVRADAHRHVQIAVRAAAGTGLGPSAEDVDVHADDARDRPHESVE